MWQNYDHVAVEEKQIAVVYPDKGCNRLFAHNKRGAMYFVVLNTPTPDIHFEICSNKFLGNTGGRGECLSPNDLLMYVEWLTLVSTWCQD